MSNTGIQCAPGTRKVGMECVPLGGEPSGLTAREYLRQYQQDLPQYQARGQGTYTGMGTGAFHPEYGRAKSSSVLSTPLISEYSGLTSTEQTQGGLSPFKISGRAAGQSGYDPVSVLHGGYRVRETPKRMDAPFSMGDPYAQGGKLWNVGRVMEDRTDPYEGVDPTLLYDLRSRAAGGALVPPGYTAGPGRTTPSEGYMSMPELLGAANIPEGSPLGRFYGGGVPSAPGQAATPSVNLGALLGSSIPIHGVSAGPGGAGPGGAGPGGAGPGGAGIPRGGRSTAGRPTGRGSSGGAGSGGAGIPRGGRSTGRGSSGGRSRSGSGSGSGSGTSTLTSP